MGEFHIETTDQKLRVRNWMHDEGQSVLLQRMFQHTALPTLRMVLVGYVNNLPTSRQNYIVPDPGYPTWSRLIEYADIDVPWANKDAGNTFFSQALLTTGKTVVPTHEWSSDGAQFHMTASYENQIANWVKCGEWFPYGHPAHHGPEPYGDYQGAAYQPDHGYPWQVPHIHGPTCWPEYASATWVDGCDNNLHRCATMKIDRVAVIITNYSCNDDHCLLFSSWLGGDFMLRPSQGVTLRYIGRFCTPDTVSEEFTEHVPRAALGPASSYFANWEAILVSNTAGSLTRKSTYSDLIPLAGCTGYSAQSLASWSILAESPPCAYHAITPWENTGGSPWPVTATYVCLTAYVNGPGTRMLAAYVPIDPPVTLPAGDRITLSNGFKFRWTSHD